MTELDMDGYRISEVAERTGFSPATLRFYERAGLLPKVARTASGYRSYDDRTIGRLRLIAQAKALGVSLEQIAELAAVWDQDECGSVQEHLVELIDEKVADAHARINQLSAFIAELDVARARLDEHTAHGPCDDTCGCLSSDAGAGREPGISIELVPRRRASTPPPIACTLDVSDVPARLDEWAELLAQAQTTEPLDDGVRIAFARDADCAAIAALAADEQACCAFLDFRLGVAADRIELEIRGPVDARPVIDTLVELRVGSDS